MPLGFRERRALLLLGDLAVASILALVALRLGAVRSDWPWSVEFLRRHLAWFVVLGGGWVAVAAANGLYDPLRTPDRWASALLSIKVSLQILVLWALAYFVPPPWTLVRHVVVFFSLGAAVAMPLWRQAAVALLGRQAFRRRLLVVGAGSAGRELVAAVRSGAPAAFEVIGFVDDDPALRSTCVEGVPVVADGDALPEALVRLQPTDLVLAIPRGVRGELLAAVLDARERGIGVTTMALLYEELTGRLPVEHVGDQWAVALPLDGGASRGAYPVAKRAMDVGVAALGLVPLALALAPMAVAAWLSGAGPLLYRQRRVGRAGREFTLVKLRTMVVDAEPDGARWAAPDDARTTRIGRWLRRSRLDELPQLWNVLRGDMSLVGPRPERPEFVDELATRIPFYRARHAVRPGLTGWAAVHEGYAGSEQESLVKLQRDLYYIKHLSPGLDACILTRTIGAATSLGGR